MGNIRLRYTGIIAYTVTLSTMLTGLLFNIVITRRLTPEELGVWRYIGTLISYFIIPSWLIGFWVTRMTAQNRQILSSSIALAAPLAAASTTAFILASNSFSEVVNFPIIVFTIASVEIPIIFFYTIFESAASAKKPHVNYYVQIFQELAKLPIAVVLVVALRLGLVGAIVATIGGFLVRLAAIIYYVRDIGWGKTDKSIAVEIISKTWLPLYSVIATNLVSLDVLVITVFYKSAEPLGYATAAFLLGSLVTMSGSLATALYPKMLQEPSPKDVEKSIQLVFMVAIPSVTAIGILSDQLLNILKPDYVVVSGVMPILLVHALTSLMLSITDSVIMGAEKADYNEGISHKNLIKSRLFLLPTLTYIYAAVYLTSLTIVIYLIHPQNTVSIITIWFSINLLASLGLLIYKIKVARKSLQFKIPFIQLGKYAATSFIMALTLFLFKPANLPVQIVEALGQLVPIIIVGAAVYFSALYLIDFDFRQLVRDILVELRTMRKPHRKPP